jgi:ferredoxin
MQIRSGLHPLSSAALCPRCLSCHVACPRCVTVLHAMTLSCHHRGVAYDHLASSRSGRSDKPMSDVISEGGRWWAGCGGCVSQHELSVRGRREAVGCTAVYMYLYTYRGGRRNGNRNHYEIRTFKIRYADMIRRACGDRSGIAYSRIRVQSRACIMACIRAVDLDAARWSGVRQGASPRDSTQNGQHIKTLSNVLESVCACLRPLPAPLGAGPLALTTSPRGSKKRSS